VYSLLASHALTGFYACDVNAGRSQKAARRRDPDRFAVLGDPAIASRFIKRLAPGTVRATFAVPAVHCASCVWLLERLWKFDQGIGRSEVDVLTRSVRIDFDPTSGSPRSDTNPCWMPRRPRSPFLPSGARSISGSVSRVLRSAT
jgi:Cu+-exporting ATPase